MIICPNCGKEFKTEEEIKKHSLPCWKRFNSDYRPKPAPQGETIITRNVTQDFLDFFEGLK